MIDPLFLDKKYVRKEKVMHKKFMNKKIRICLTKYILTYMYINLVLTILIINFSGKGESYGICIAPFVVLKLDN